MTVIATRGWPEPAAGWEPSTFAVAQARPPSERDEVLSFTIEMSPDFRQDLVALAWCLERDGRSIEVGIAHPEGTEPPSVGPGVVVRPLAWWLDRRLHAYGYKRQALVIAEHLAFSLSRLANRDRWDTVRAGRLRRANPLQGGFRLYLFGGPRLDDPSRWHTTKYRHDLLVTHLGAGGITFYRWAPGFDDAADGRNFTTHPGRFCDLGTAFYAVSGAEGSSLEEMRSVLGLEPSPPPAGEAARAANRLVERVTSLTEVTAAVRRMAHRHKGLRSRLHVERLHSPAALAGAYLGAMGITPPLAANPAFDRRILGAGFAAFHGGRVAVNPALVGHQLPVAWLDLRSTYPAVCVHKGLWRYLVAERLELVDRTAEVVAELDTPRLAERWLDPATHRHFGVTLVRIAPGGDPLPHLVHRALTPTGWRTTVGPIDMRGREGWWALDDAVASAITTGVAPAVIEAVTVSPVGVQSGLHPVTMPSGAVFDPTTGDFHEALMAERRAAEASGDALGATALKVPSNAATWGVAARTDQGPRLATGAEMTVWDGTASPRTVDVDRVERPGPWSFPPLASVICGAARLALAQMERLVAAAGGTWATMDTDSIAVLATPDGSTLDVDEASLRAMSFAEVEELRQPFVALGGGQPWWKVEHESTSLPTWALLGGPKTYVVYRTPGEGTAPLGPDEEPEIVGGTTFGLAGSYLDPTRGQAEPVGGMVGWVAAAWRRHLRMVAGTRDGDGHNEEPEWFTEPALRPQVYSTPGLVQSSHLPDPWPFSTYVAGQVRRFITIEPGVTPCRPAPSAGVVLPGDDERWLDHATGKPIPLGDDHRRLDRIGDVSYARHRGRPKPADDAPTVVDRRLVIGRERAGDDEIPDAAAVPGTTHAERAPVYGSDCPECGRPLDGRRRDQVRHDACAAASRARTYRARRRAATGGAEADETRTCDCCGDELPTPSAAGRRFCDDACRKDAARNGTEGRCPVPGCREWAPPDGGPCTWCSPEHADDTARATE